MGEKQAWPCFRPALGAAESGPEKALKRGMYSACSELAANCGDEQAEFICECADLMCPALVRLSVTAVEQHRAAGRPILAQDHLAA